MKSEIVNRWGHTLRVGMLVQVHHPRGGKYGDTIAAIEPSDDYSRAYGRQVRFTSGRSAGVDDCAPVANLGGI